MSKSNIINLNHLCMRVFQKKRRRSQLNELIHLSIITLFVEQPLSKPPKYRLTSISLDTLGLLQASGFIINNLWFMWNNINSLSQDFLHFLVQPVWHNLPCCHQTWKIFKKFTKRNFYGAKLYIYLLWFKLPNFPRVKNFLPETISKASALWADAFYKSICPYVCVCLFTF